ncbi:glycerate kinase [Caenimonas aquaedulcis]|uniref:Glycerate kinase n=1 Tax=Caenimonas aquaedulcis TaxID=2793270 RepID=A0A931H5R6_9BURK|nr:glycerate kinase [Caenimonas aquaedulcis]MBG9389166.1 glycerate kinase [Caenimonas aquaedulcis]
MNWQKIFLPIAGAVLIVVAFQTYGWAGAALAVTAVAMYLLLHFNRLMHVLRRAADRPKGYVASAVMLNAKLKPGVNLLHVMAMTDSLGELISKEGEQPEMYRWTDPGDSHVTCEFAGGKLVKWTLYRPPQPDEASPPAAS